MILGLEIDSFEVCHNFWFSQPSYSQTQKVMSVLKSSSVWYKVCRVQIKHLFPSILSHQ